VGIVVSKTLEQFFMGFSNLVSYSKFRKSRRRLLPNRPGIKTCSSLIFENYMLIY
jgi:hypothetical protein